MLSKIPFFYLFKQMWRFAEGNRRNVILFLIMQLIGVTINSVEPLILGLLLNTVQNEGVTSQSLFKLLSILALFPLMELMFWLIWWPSRIIERRNAFYVVNKYRMYLLQGTLNLPLEWHVNNHSGDTIDKVENGTSSLYGFSEHIFEFLETGVQLVIAAAVLVYFNAYAGAIGIVFIGITSYFLIQFDKKLVDSYKKLNKMRNDISAKVYDSISNVTTVVILRASKLILKSLKHVIYKPEAEFVRNIKLNEWKWFSASMLGRISVFIVMGLFIYLQSKVGLLAVGTIVILYEYANQIRGTFYRVAYLYNDVVRQRTAVANAEELSNNFIESKSTKAKTLPARWKVLNISGLSFSYHTKEGADLHIEDVAMEIKSGQRIAIIGESGGGKTTFLKLLRDLYKPQQLSLNVDNKPFDNFEKISDSIALIPQDPEIFNATIRENITIGIDYTDKEIKKLTDIARFTEVVKRLPKGLESSIVEKGVNLSGGEKQRLALVRGLLVASDKDILLLDEPTSSVDFHNELAIYQNIFSTFKKQTIISSIHRLHLLQLFDVIYFFKGGKIIASGSFEDLKSFSPPFQELWHRYTKIREE